MKGKLHHTKEGWTVTYITSDPLPNGKRWVRIDELLIHPSSFGSVMQMYVDDVYSIVYTRDGENVDFEIVEGFAKLV